MARKGRKRTDRRLPLIRGEIWEIGRRALDVHTAKQIPQDERPEMLLAVQTGQAGGVVFADAVTSQAPITALKEFALQAMRQPMIGQPRRPEVIRVDSQAEAEMLAVVLDETGVVVEVFSPLVTLNAVHDHMETMLSGMDCDYRTRAMEAGETLSDDGLRAFFRTARAFYQEAIWEAFGDEALFEIALQPTQGLARTFYGVLTGNFGEEPGLTLYPSLEDFQEFYELSIERLDQLASFPQEVAASELDSEQWQAMTDMTAQFMVIPSLTLTYSPQRDAPPPLVQEARRLKLRLANRSAFPVVLSTGQAGMQIATATALSDMFVAMRAILEWDKRIDNMADESEIDVTIMSTLKGVKGFVPETTIHTTLRDNPCLPERDDETFWPTIDAPFEALLTQSLADGSASGRKEPRKAAFDGPAKSRQKSPKSFSHHVYRLNIHLVAGPITSAYAGQEISRVMDIRGNQTLHELHRAIFEAFGRWEEHLYEFNLGVAPSDQSQTYFYSGGWDTDDSNGWNPETTVLDVLDLSVDRCFGYTFDMGDQWEHIIKVIAIKEIPGKGKYPRIVKKVGKAPPQHPQDDASDDAW